MPALKTKVNGIITGIHGSVIQMHFEEDLPAINSLLYTGAKEEVAIEVLTQIDQHKVSGIALTPTQGLARGMAVRNTIIRHLELSWPAI